MWAWKRDIVLWPLGDGIVCTIIIKNTQSEVRPALEPWLCHTYYVITIDYYVISSRLPQALNFFLYEVRKIIMPATYRIK